MKRLSSKARSRHIARARRRSRRELARKRRRSAKRASIAVASVSDLPEAFVPELRRKARVLPGPKSINLSSDYEETINFLGQVERLSVEPRRPTYVDLSTVESISPAGALALVAAFDEWRLRTLGKRLRPVSLKHWNAPVRRTLKEMGFFEVLKARCDIDDEPPPGADRFLPFITGIASEGESARRLRQGIETLGPKLADREALYDCLVEAMANVKHHAYAEGSAVKNWWMSASINVDARKLTVMFLDHGQGIPATLPRSSIWENVRGWLSEVLPSGSVPDDAKLIEAALSVQKSRTLESHRGHGLRRDIRGYIEKHDSTGSLRILSRRGKCIYSRKPSGQENLVATSLPVALRGSFIEWRVEDYGEQDSSQAN